MNSLTGTQMTGEVDLELLHIYIHCRVEHLRFFLVAQKKIEAARFFPSAALG